MIKKLIATSIIIGMTTSMIGCKSNKVINNNSENNINSNDIVELIEEKNEDKQDKFKLGNSINNILSGGLVAYNDKYVYYSEENNYGKESKYNLSFYKKNIETNEVKELVDERAMYINIYEDYIYYVNSTGAMIVTDEIKRIKNDGTGLEVVVSKSENVAHTNVQVIGDFIYYAVYLDGNSDTATKMDLMKMNLKTLEKYKIKTVDTGDIISINNNGTIEIYIRPYNPSNWIFTNIIQIKEDKDSDIEVLDISDKNITTIIGFDNNEVYYKVMDELGHVKILKKDIKDINSKEEFISAKKEYLNNGYIDAKESLIGENYIYFLSGFNTLKRLNLKTDKIDIVKDINTRMPYAQRDVDVLVLFEVKGNLAYYNEEGKLIIDDSIDINEKYISNKDDISFNIFDPNRKLTIDEAIELVYYRVGERITEDSMLSKHDDRECLQVRYIYRENGVGLAFVDLNSGEINIEYEPKWEKYTKTKEELKIGTAYGWESKNSILNNEEYVDEDKMKNDYEKEIIELSKKEYLDKMDSLDFNLNTKLKDKLEGTTLDMKEATSEIYIAWDEILNEIYSKIINILSEEEKDKLILEETNWIKERDEKADSAAKKVEGGSMEQIVRTSSLTNSTKERCYELVNNYMK